jgi:hypothetical protein
MEQKKSANGATYTSLGRKPQVRIAYRSER